MDEEVGGWFYFVGGVFFEVGEVEGGGGGEATAGLQGAQDGGEAEEVLEAEGFEVAEVDARALFFLGGEVAIAIAVAVVVVVVVVVIVAGRASAVTTAVPGRPAAVAAVVPGRAAAVVVAVAA